MINIIIITIIIIIIIVSHQREVVVGLLRDSGSYRCALIGVPWRLRIISIFSTFDNMLKLTILAISVRLSSASSE